MNKQEETEILKDVKATLIKFADVARPFTSGDAVDKLMSNSPLMERLEVAIERAEKSMRGKS